MATATQVQRAQMALADIERRLAANAAVQQQQHDDAPAFFHGGGGGLGYSAEAQAALKDQGHI